MSYVKQLGTLLAEELELSCHIEEGEIGFYDRPQPVYWFGKIIFESAEEYLYVKVTFCIQEGEHILTCPDVPSARAFLEELRFNFPFGTLDIIHNDDTIAVYLRRCFSYRLSDADSEEEVSDDAVEQFLTEIENLVEEIKALQNSFWVLCSNQLNTAEALALYHAVVDGSTH